MIFSYDANGSLTDKARSGTDAVASVYSYDLGNRMTGSTMTRNGTTTVTAYACNEAGIRIIGTVNGQRTVFTIYAKKPPLPPGAGGEGVGGGHAEIGRDRPGRCSALSNLMSDGAPVT